MKKIKTLEEFRNNVNEKVDCAVLKFTATWCGPCRVVAPILEELEKEYKDNEKKVLFFEIDSTNDRELVNEFEVKAVPTLIFFNKGERVGKLVTGVRKKENYEEMIKGVLSGKYDLIK